jgi:hypothetical protein
MNSMEFGRTSKMTSIMNNRNSVKGKPIKAKESVVVYKLGDGYTVRASWHNEEILISGKDKEKLQVVIDNLFTIRDAKRAAEDIYNYKR